MKLKYIFDELCRLAPLGLQMDFDNSGFQIGHMDAEVSRVLLSLDVTEAVIDEAIASKADLIVSHHPLIFRPLRSLNGDDLVGRKVLRLAENRIALISMHTNLDIADGGVNDVLLKTLGVAPLGKFGEDLCGRYGELSEPCALEDFLQRVQSALGVNGIKFMRGGREVRRIGVLGGAGADYMQAALSVGCDTFVTADIKYHEYLNARDFGLNLIDADHYCEEAPVMQTLCEHLAQCFPETEFFVSSEHHQLTEQF